MLETLITLPEGKTLEFERDLSSPKPLLKTLVAFANTAGGKLVIGVADDRQVIGVEDPLAEEERELNLIEQWGSGIRRIFQEAAKQKLPTPEIVEIGMRVRFTVPLAAPLVISEITPQVTPQVKALMQAIHGEKTRDELQTLLGLADRENFRINYLLPAIASEWIERTIPEKPNSRLQKYRLTPLGRSLLEK